MVEKSKIPDIIFESIPSPYVRVQRDTLGTVGARPFSAPLSLRTNIWIVYLRSIIGRQNTRKSAFCQFDVLNRRVITGNRYYSN